MGSRRARRAHGRVQPAQALKKKYAAPNSISKLQRKKARRMQLRTELLTAAKAARLAKQSQPPLLIGVLSVCGARDDQMRALCATIHSTETEKSVQPFETYVLSRNGRSQRQVLTAALDMAKVADIMLLVFSGRDDMDLESVELLRALRSQGMPSMHIIALGDGADDPALRKLRGRQLAAESLGEDHTLRPIHFSISNSDGDAQKNKSALRRVFAKPPRIVSWRSRYGYMRVESAVVDEQLADATSNLTLCGWIRGRGMSANELVHITGFGSYAVNKIVDCSSGAVLSKRNETEAEPPESVGDVDEMMGEQTWPPEVVGEEADEEDETEKLAKQYDETLEAEERVEVERELEDSMVDDTEGDKLSEMDDEKMSVDEEEIKRLREAAKTDSEFPDEVDVPIDQPARIRFARYRGLKSLRTGEWDPKEQLPEDYASLFQFRNLPATKKQVLKRANQAAQMASAGKGCSNFASCGKKVYIELKEVPKDIQTHIVSMLKSNEVPLVASGMLRHENRRSVVHFGVQRIDDEEDAPTIKAKTPLEMHCGFVRFEGRPMFSENNPNCANHKMERYLRHGRYTVVSFYGPAIYAPAPALLCHRNGSVIAAGSALGADVDRIILKRIVLTGYPFKTQKRRSVVRFMFFNADDVRWFKPVELWTKLGRSGHILEPVGTHGHMKCIFDNVVLHHDTICMTLYKRVYPKLME
eukprot:TRINITY_DN63513_c0_g1_i1.p1 TRINITY_DN63513_c0_g1~~TRINITY_DN63513_c0_g1_i1.p1  ORF type:complete len:700 (+),score=120.93 TRINITY_DN63513_c0_g1_i1:405-2504(+)